jgi:hypothetical protein
MPSPNAVPFVTEGECKGKGKVNVKMEMEIWRMILPFRGLFLPGIAKPALTILGIFDAAVPC